MPPYLAEIPYGFKNLWEITVSALTFEPPQIIAENITEVNLNGATVTTQQLITLYDWNRDLCAVHLTGGDPYLVTLTGYHREGNISFRLFLQAGGGGGGSSDHRLLTHRSDSDQHPISAITGLSAALNTKYELPSGGIPATDLASAVQTNLGKANTALQPSALNDYRTAAAQNTIDASKLDVFQGTTHSGKLMTVNSSGNVVPGIKFDPDSKTANMTQSVGIDSNGKLYTEPGGGGGGGADGVGIVSITYARTDASGGNVYTVLLSDGTSYEITAPKGAAGSDGESAYAAAVEGGYAGTEAEFNSDMANMPTITDFFIQTATSANMFNKDDSGIIADLMLTSGGGQREQTGSSVTHILPVVYGVSYTYPFDSSFYGVNHTVQYFADASATQCYDTQTDGTVSDGLLTFTATHTGFIRVNFTTRTLDSMMFCRTDQYPDSYQPYGGETLISAPSLNPLYGKKISIDGDSIARGTGNNDVGYGEIIAARNNMVVENKASGGGTIVNVTGHHCISTSAITLAADSDYYIVEGGINDTDANYNIPAGTISEGYSATLDTSTFAGAFETMLKGMITTFAGKKIGYIIPHYITPEFSDGGFLDPPATTFYDIAKRCCAKWGVPCLDLSKVVPTLAYIQSLKTAYTSNADGWHPTDAGYKKFYCDKIEAWLAALNFCDGTTNDYDDLTNKPKINSVTLSGNKSLSDIGAVAAPANPTTGQFLKWDGTAWVASGLPVYDGSVI